ncbi:MAG: hypothetical protein NVSMB32_13450 [Actinomycetota bacterium]
MADLVFVAIMVGFFALAAALVAGCERIVGSAGTLDEDRAERCDADLAASSGVAA